MASRALPDLVARLIIDERGGTAALSRLTVGSAGVSQSLAQVEAAGARMSQGLAKNFGVLLSNLQGVVPGAGQLSSALAGVGAEGLSLGGVMGALGPALPAAALVGTALAAKSAADAFGATGGELHDFQLISGATAEEASRLSYVMKAAGVDSGMAATAFYQLGKRAETVPDTFAKLGIEIKKTDQGNIDSLGTLEAVRKAWQNAGSAAERDTILFTAFGRSGKALADVMAMNDEEFRALASHAGVFTQEQITRAHDYEITMRELGLQVDLVKAQIGSQLAPSIERTTMAMVNSSSAIEKLLEGLNSVSGGADWFGRVLSAATFGTSDLIAHLGGADAASQKSAQSLKTLADVNSLGASAADEEAQGQNDLAAALKNVQAGVEAQLPAKHQLADATAALQAAEAGETSATGGVEAAQRKVADATTTHENALRSLALAHDAYNAKPTESNLLRLQTAQANADASTRHLAQAQDLLTQASDGGAAADRARADAADRVVQATVASMTADYQSQGVQVDGAIKANIEANAYYNVAQQLRAMGDPALATQFEQTGDRIIAKAQGITATVNSIPRSFTIVGYVTANIDPRLVALAKAGQLTPSELREALEGRQAGGPVAAGQAYVVGEGGPEIFVPSEPGSIYPAGATARTTGLIASLEGEWRGRMGAALAALQGLAGGAVRNWGVMDADADAGWRRIGKAVTDSATQSSQVAVATLQGYLEPQTAASWAAMEGTVGGSTSRMAAAVAGSSASMEGSVTGSQWRTQAVVAGTQASIEAAVTGSSQRGSQAAQAAFAGMAAGVGASFGGLWGSVHGGLQSAAGAIGDFDARVNAIPLVSGGIGYLPERGSMTAFARGAIVDRPTPGVFGEAGPEALIPLGRGAGRGRGVDLWLTAGEMLGALRPGSRGKGGGFDVGTYGGECLAWVGDVTGGFGRGFYAAIDLCGYASDGQPAGTVGISRIPPWGHAWINLGGGMVIDSNWVAPGIIGKHPLSDIPLQCGSIPIGPIAGLPAVLTPAEVRAQLQQLVNQALGGLGGWPRGVAANVIGAEINGAVAKFDQGGEWAPRTWGYNAGAGGSEWVTTGDQMRQQNGLLQDQNRLLRAQLEILAHIDGRPGLSASAALRRGGA